MYSGDTQLNNFTPFNDPHLKKLTPSLTWKCSIFLTVHGMPTKHFLAPEWLKVRINARKRRLPRRWTLSKSHLFFSPSSPSPLLKFCVSLFSSAGGFWSLSEWQVWAFALRKGYRHFQTAKFTSGGDIRQNDTFAHAVNRSNSREEFSVIFWFNSLAVFFSFLIFNPRLKMLS